MGKCRRVIEGGKRHIAKEKNVQVSPCRSLWPRFEFLLNLAWNVNAHIKLLFEHSTTQHAQAKLQT